MTFPSTLQFLLVGFTAFTLYFSYLATLDITTSLSPQGCRMSYMSPSYVLQKGLDERWTSLAKRYSLWLYREVGWEDGKPPTGLPVLFIPGNAGASGQVRSIASSAARQYFARPGIVAQEFEAGWKRAAKPLDFFALEFNEDLSAFHGPTLESQIHYTASAISYILSLYPANTQVIVLGHSMGGIVATALLPSPNISAVITMSSPHTLPPARFDARIDTIYAKNQRLLASDAMPIVSLCGGATDMMIPSEACVLPPVADSRDGRPKPYRRTVFSSALEGAWTGVGHREMVWCHQVRWRVARAALELGAVSTEDDKNAVLDTWLRDGHMLPLTSRSNKDAIKVVGAEYEVLPEGTELILKNPRGSMMYMLPKRSGKLVLYVSGGSISGISPYKPLPLYVTPHICHHGPSDEASVLCNPLEPNTLRLIPNPVPGRSFPVPHEGVDESEGVVLFEADISVDDGPGDDHDRWVGIKIDAADGRGWVVAGFASSSIDVRNDVGTVGISLWGAIIPVPQRLRLRLQVVLPNLLSNVLAVYKLSPRFTSTKDASSCADTLLPPLVMHPSHPVEAHYFPLIPITTPSQRILLHTHGSAPYIPQLPGSSRGLNLVIYTSGGTGCGTDLEALSLGLDWSATFGRWVSRYPTTLVCWTVGVVALIIFRAWGMSDKGHAPMPTVSHSLSDFIRRILPRLLWVSFFVSFIPFPGSLYLGNRGEPLLSFLAPLLLCLATGIVCATWWLLLVLIWPIRKICGIISSSERGKTRAVRRSTMVSLALVCGLILLLVPWQVAYLGCWIFHLFTCASAVPSMSATSTTVMPLLDRNVDSLGNSDGEVHSRSSPPTATEHCSDAQRHRRSVDNHNQNMHLLLFMTWLLPLTAPTLAVWVRTLITAGLTTPFDGDHNFLRVVPFLVLVDFASWTTEALFQRQRFEDRLSVRWLLVGVAVVAAFVGPRKVYSLFDAATAAVGMIVLVRIGRRYWGGSSWTNSVTGTPRQ